MKDTVDNSKNRAGVYALLAEALAPPPHMEALTRLGNGTWLKEISEFLALLDNPIVIPAALRQSAATADQLGREYLEAFFLPDGRRIWLVESVYKPWTLDESAEVSFKAETGWLGGDSAVHMQELIKQMGIELPPEIRGTPDHLAIILELMSLLAEEADRDSQALFLAQHLDWLPQLMARCAEAGLGGLYQAIVEMTAEFIAWDRRQIDPGQTARHFQGFREG